MLTMIKENENKENKENNSTNLYPSSLKQGL